jgi:hypothetical protein
MPSLEPFVSRSDLTDYLGRDVTEDAGALSAVDAACDICRTVAGQSFNEVLEDEIKLDGAEIDSLVLPEFPVTGAGTVSIAGTVVTDYTLDEANGILYRTSGTATPYCYQPRSWPYSTRYWPWGRQNIEVTYDHGYAEADFPRDVRMVALTVASRLVVQGVAMREDLDGVKIFYAGESTALMPTERLILEKYRRTR